VSILVHIYWIVSIDGHNFKMVSKLDCASGYNIVTTANSLWVLKLCTPCIITNGFVSNKQNLACMKFT